MTLRHSSQVATECKDIPAFFTVLTRKFLKTFHCSTLFMIHDSCNRFRSVFLDVSLIYIKKKYKQSFGNHVSMATVFAKPFHDPVLWLPRDNAS